MSVDADSSKSKKKELKDLASNGRFDEILEEHGAKILNRLISWSETKLATAVNSKDDTISLTPFFQFCMTSSGDDDRKLDILDLAKIFAEKKVNSEALVTVSSQSVATTELHEKNSISSSKYTHANSNTDEISKDIPKCYVENGDDSEALKESELSDVCLEQDGRPGSNSQVNSVQSVSATASAKRFQEPPVKRSGFQLPVSSNKNISAETGPSKQKERRKKTSELNSKKAKAKNSELDIRPSKKSRSQKMQKCTEDEKSTSTRLSQSSQAVPKKVSKLHSRDVDEDDDSQGEEVEEGGEDEEEWDPDTNQLTKTVVKRFFNAKSKSNKRISKKDFLSKKNSQAKDTRKKINKKLKAIVEYHSSWTDVRGIKQNDLPIDLNLQGMKKIDQAAEAFPSENVLKIGQMVVLVLEPYREFISCLPSNIPQAHLTEAQIICNLHTDIIRYARVISFESCPTKHSKGNSSNLQDLKIVKITVPTEIDTTSTICGGGSHSTSSPPNSQFSKKRDQEDKQFSDKFTTEYSILYAPVSSPLHKTDAFLVNKSKFDKSLEQSWLVVNAQVAKVFSREKEGNGFGNPQIEGYLEEGSIYHVRRDMVEHPYKSIKVCWLTQEYGTNAWVYSYEQVENEVSPWELNLSKYVLKCNVKAPTLPPSMLPSILACSTSTDDENDSLANDDDFDANASKLDHQLQPLSVKPEYVLEYISNLEFAKYFDLDMSDNIEFCAMFPDSADHINIPILNRRCKDGSYNAQEVETVRLSESSLKSLREAQEKGLWTLFEDAFQMVRISKRFNDCNHDFQVWRSADMLQMALSDLMRDIAEIHSLPMLAAAASHYFATIEQESAMEEADF